MDEDSVAIRRILLTLLVTALRSRCEDEATEWALGEARNGRVV
jgi:hypothetical protein